MKSCSSCAHNSPAGDFNCRRYPNPTEHAPEYWCGEWKDMRDKDVAEATSSFTLEVVDQLAKAVRVNTEWLHTLDTKVAELSIRLIADPSPADGENS